MGGKLLLKLHRQQETLNPIGGTIMSRALLTLAAGIIFGAGGMFAAQQHGHQAAGTVKILSARDIKEKLDGKEMKASFVEVTYEAGQAGQPHRHPGPAFGYVVEGEFEFAIDDEPAKVLKAGETFYEPSDCLHRVTKNAGQAKTRVIAVVIHPRDAKQIAIPELKKD
jgi:quercetin dioxygenase-like cupin family protein